MKFMMTIFIVSDEFFIIFFLLSFSFSWASSMTGLRLKFLRNFLSHFIHIFIIRLPLIHYSFLIKLIWPVVWWWRFFSFIGNSKLKWKSYWGVFRSLEIDIWDMGGLGFKIAFIYGISWVYFFLLWNEKLIELIKWVINF